MPQIMLQDPSAVYSRRGILRGGMQVGAALATAKKVGRADIPADQVPGFGKAKSVIVIFASGGQSQLDMWDPKPDAPVEIRGEFSSISTRIPGAAFCEHMPQIAKIADRLSVVRSMSHEDLDHGSAFYLAMTGRYHRRRSANPPPAADDHPCYGAVLQRVRPATQFSQTAIHLNGPALVPELEAPGQFGGFLGRGFDPLTLGDVASEPVAIPSLLPHADLSRVRMESRRSLLQAVESQMKDLESQTVMLEKDAMYQQAFRMLQRPEARTAFDLSREPEALRRRYGLNRSGQACLLARRLAEAGVPLSTVIWSYSNRGQDKAPNNKDSYGWDTHNDIFTGLKDHLLPRFDQGFSALIEDLDQRGMLDSTLVIAMGEFGRAPLVALEPRFAGAAPGRKHWASVYSIAFAGAGVQQGSVVGASDESGAYPDSQSWGPWDVIATIFSALGIDPAGHFKDHVGRPLMISEGKVIQPLYGSL